MYARASRRARWADLWRAHGLGHAEEDCHSLAAAAGGQGFGRHAETTVEVRPVLHHPPNARGSNGQIGLHLQATANIAAWRADLVAGLEAGRAVLGTRAAELRDWIVRSGEVGDPDIVVAVDGRRPGSRQAARRE